MITNLLRLGKITCAILACALPLAIHAANPPRVSDSAPDFTLKTLDHQSVHFNELVTKSRVVLVVLRGWPGYQCPICARQAHDFVRHADQFKKDNAQVIMVYPGPAEDLQAHAAEFLHDKNWPKDFILVLDPDYTFTRAYGLRWDAPKETAYPSTFIVSQAGKVLYAHISRGHGDRVSAETVLAKLAPIP